MNTVLPNFAKAVLLRSLGSTRRRPLAKTKMPEKNFFSGSVRAQGFVYSV